MQQQPRERVKRPQLPFVQEEEEILDQDEMNEYLTQNIIKLELAKLRGKKADLTKDLSQDDLNEWLAMKTMKLEAEVVGDTPPRAIARQFVPQPKKDLKGKEIKKNLYEDVYGDPELEEPTKAKGKSKAKPIIIFLIIIIVAWALIQLGLYLFAGYSLPGQ